MSESLQAHPVDVGKAGTQGRSIVEGAAQRHGAGIVENLR